MSITQLTRAMSLSTPRSKWDYILLVSNGWNFANEMSRWVMYNWRIVSFLTFSSAFWVFSMAVTCSVWMVLSLSDDDPADRKAIKKENFGGGDDDFGISIKKEQGREPTPSGSTAMVGDDSKKVKKEEDVEESTALEPLAFAGNEKMDGSSEEYDSESSSTAR